jgi:hypothetical protein
MEMERLWAWWWSRQGLDGSLKGSTPQEALVRSGWSRSVGGASPYISIFARTGSTMAEVDKAVANSQILELPSARGCTHVLPKEDFALGLRVAQGFGDDASIAMAKKHLGVSESELDHLREAVIKALVKGELDPKQIKDAVGGAARHLGEEGRKRGTTNTLSLALSSLQTHGQIRRVPESGRLDRQRYRYATWSPNPLGNSHLTREEAFTELARNYFRWIGPASLAHFRWFSGLGAGAAKEAIAPLNLAPIESGSNLLVLPGDLDAFHSFKMPSEPIYTLVASLDGYLLHRRDIVSLFSDENLDCQIPTSDKFALVTSLQDLSCNAILDRGRIVGLWEYDPEALEIVAISFVGMPRALQEEIYQMKAFVKDQLGDCRSFSLDSPESRKPKLALLRQMAEK